MNKHDKNFYSSQQQQLEEDSSATSDGFLIAIVFIIALCMDSIVSLFLGL